jgi:hypothetical protein
MVHFMVVGKRNMFMGYVKDVTQLFSSPKSAFYRQDLISNMYGVKFFNNYRYALDKYPSMFTDYLYHYFTGQPVH